MRKRKVYDCCIYNSEWQMLNFRLHELNDVVDKFIIVEGKYTFQCAKKDRPMLDISTLPFQDKIIHKVLDGPPDPDPWVNESTIRDFCIEGLRDIELYSNDIILGSDVDEIPDSKEIAHIKKHGLEGYKQITCLQNFFYYNVYTMKPKKFASTRITTVEMLLKEYDKSFHKLRTLPPNKYVKYLGGSDNNPDWESGGWHFSYFGDENFIIDKIESFNHFEYNLPEYKDPEKIKQAIKEGKDVFFRGGMEDMIIDYNRKYMPKFIHLLK